MITGYGDKSYADSGDKFYSQTAMLAQNHGLYRSYDYDYEKAEQKATRDADKLIGDVNILSEYREAKGR